MSQTTTYDQNFLQNSLWQMTIAKLPTVPYMLQGFSLPGLNLPSVPVPNPFINVNTPGDHITYDELGIDFKVDENLDNYFFIYQWLQQLGFPKNFNQYADITNSVPAGGKYSDGSMIIYDALKNPNRRITFTDMFPTRLTPLQFQSTSDDVVYLSASAIFKFQTIKVASVNAVSQQTDI